jgi:hypothetical protein
MSKKTEERYKSLPAGVRNNNYLNIKKSASKWKGTRLPERSHPFVEFVSPEWGYRAAFIIMGKSYRKRGLKTVSQIISAWAPGSENNTSLYISYVLKEMILDLDLYKVRDIEMPDPVPFDPYAEIQSLSKEQLNAFNYWHSLAQAMTCIEVGMIYARRAEVSLWIDEGYKLAICEKIP